MKICLINKKEIVMINMASKDLNNFLKEIAILISQDLGVDSVSKEQKIFSETFLVEEIHLKNSKTFSEAQIQVFQYNLEDLPYFKDLIISTLILFKFFWAKEGKIVQVRKNKIIRKKDKSNIINRKEVRNKSISKRCHNHIREISRNIKIKNLKFSKIRKRVRSVLLEDLIPDSEEVSVGLVKDFLIIVLMKMIFLEEVLADFRILDQVPKPFKAQTSVEPVEAQNL